MLSSKKSELIENLIVKYGQIVTAQQIFSETSDSLSRKQIQYIITTLTKQGWFIRIKKGLYAGTHMCLSSRHFTIMECLIN